MFCSARDSMHEDTETFRISSLQEADSFAAYISRYGDSTSVGYDIREHIRNIYNYSRVHSSSDRINGKLLNAYIDLEITYLFMMKESQTAGGTHNSLHDAGKIALGSVLDVFDLFSGKMEILHSLSAFSFRIRSFWDKYMGVLFLLYKDQKYEKYIKARSKKAFFVKHAKEWPEVSVHLRQSLTNIVRTWLIHSGQTKAAKEIDKEQLCVEFPDPFLNLLGEIVEMVDAVRTPEAHGTGALRKWTLANLPIDRSRDFALMNDWNHANEFMPALRRAIAELAARSSSHQR